MNGQAVKNLQTLAQVPTTAKKAMDDVWAQTTLEQSMRIRNNLLDEAKSHEAKQNGGPTE